MKITLFTSLSIRYPVAKLETIIANRNTCMTLPLSMANALIPPR
jgi:hypothetical protein